MLITKERFWELFRFGVVGTTAMLIHYGIYYVLLPYMNMNIAYSIGYFLSFLCNFMMSSYFTFKVKPNKKKAGGFALSHLINWGIQTLLLNFFIWVGVDKVWAPWPMYAISAPINFLFVRFFVKTKGN